MTDITPNHLHIYRDRRGKHITLDGQDLLLDGEDPMLITGMENPAEVTRVMLTLLAPKITVDSEIEDREPEPATVDAPEPTLAEQIEQERDQALAEVERLTAERVTDPSLTLNDGSMTRPATVAREENVSHDLPEPADVKPGEAWLVSCGGGEPRHGFRRGDGQRLPWVMSDDDTVAYASDSNITLVSRLVLAPRVITNTEELEALAEGTIVRGGDGHAWENVAGKWCGHRAFGAISAGALTHSGPVTVLWTPVETE